MESLFRGTRMGLKFAPNISLMFKELTNLPDRYEEAGRRGFRAVECQFPYDSNIEDLVRAKYSAGVEQVLINSFQGKGHGDAGFACQPNRQEDFKKSIELTIRYAKALNCKKVHIMAGVSQQGVTAPEMESMYIYNLCYAAEKLQGAGIMGLIEPLCAQVRDDYFLKSYDKALEYVKKVNSRHLRIMLDVFHLQMLHGNLSTKISQLARFVGHVQISQAPKRTEPSAPGEIDYHYVLELLNELGYRDYIGLEYCPSGKTVDSMRFLKDWGYMPELNLE
ncbi:putative hydroxypyruvate isomerase isoform X2 [Varroa jacobsoni]|uniref:putative hydroxypyruvate isomerase isoform X2 n=1 Tax=Varroa jacobsoni TaxID=62625 RepID=UPI000BF700AC|nr:putative hydroxypyruvate isomerase isoform X2 [Varroa jacobsoni]